MRKNTEGKHNRTNTEQDKTKKKNSSEYFFLVEEMESGDDSLFFIGLSFCSLSGARTRVTLSQNSLYQKVLFAG
jgi:hypothetical protein